MAESVVGMVPPNDKVTQVMCGHCKFTCQDIEELKEHMKANHLQNMPGIDQSQINLETPMEAETRKQTVVVYKQNADGTTVNTGQVVRLTQNQILQLLQTSPGGQQKTIDGQSDAADMQRLLPLQGSSVTVGGKKQLAVVGPENVATLEKTALGSADQEAMKTKTPSSASAARISLLAAGVPSFISKEAPDGEEGGTIDLKFRFSLANSTDMIDEHIKPVVNFQCKYCGYKDTSYVKACVHVTNFHLSPDGTVLEASKAVKSDVVEGSTPVTEADLQCPYCLLKFFTLDDRDFHRLKKCGPKQRYEVKRTAVRSLQKHLLCNEGSCTRALYFKDHPQAIKHPRATFGSCHRNNGPSHYFSCYVCASKSADEWKEKGAKELEDMVTDRVRRLNEKLSNYSQRGANRGDDSAQPIDKGDEEATTTDSKQEETIHIPTSREPLVREEEMRAWDFKTWADCADHLLSNHLEVLNDAPQCGVCKKQLTSCNSLCLHVFNNEREYVENLMLNLRRKESKRAAKKGLIFGLTKDNAADKMLFTDLAGGDFAGLPPRTDPETGAVIARPATRNKHFMCRTCGQGFGSAAKRNKHILSNACVRDKVVKNYECSVCSKKFSMRKTMVAHETWCLYKQKRDTLLKMDGSGLEGNSLTTDTSDEVAGVSEAGLEGKKERRRRAAKFKCTIEGCIMGFNSAKELAIHRRCHVGTTVAYRCCFCDFTAAATVNWYPLKEHIIAKHPGNIPSAFECTICAKGFAKQSKYDDHMTKHSTDRHHKCIECGLTFKQESGLRTHVQYEHGTEEAKEFARMALKHRSSDGQTPQQLLCYVCGYATNSRSYYKTHMNIHKGVKPYNCKYCDYKSVDSTCFKRHMWRHQDKKPYKCTYCPFDGIQRSQIVAHMRSKHNVWPDEAKKLIKHISGRSASNLQRPRIGHSVDDSIVGVSADATMSEHTELPPPSEPATTTVSIVNPDGSETTIPVELITQAAQGLAAGTNLQVAYGDYMINYTLEKPREDEGMTDQTLVVSQDAIQVDHSLQVPRGLQVSQTIDTSQPMEVSHAIEPQIIDASSILLEAAGEK